MPFDANITKKPKEELIWQARSSQVLNINKFIGYVMLMLLVIPVYCFKEEIGPYYQIIEAALVLIPTLLIVKDWLIVDSQYYELTTQRLIYQYGVFSKITGEIELYRVKDVTCHEPFHERIMGYGKIVLDTSDKNAPIMVIDGIKNPLDIQNKIRKQVEIIRKATGVREFD